MTCQYSTELRHAMLLKCQVRASATSRCKFPHHLQQPIYNVILHLPHICIYMTLLEPNLIAEQSKSKHLLHRSTICVSAVMHSYSCPVWHGCQAVTHE